MRIIISFFLFLFIIINGTYQVKAKNILIEKKITQDKYDLLFLINLAMRGVSSNNVEQDVKNNKKFCDQISFSVAKGLFPLPGYNHISCKKNTLQLSFYHVGKKRSIWDGAAVGYDWQSASRKYSEKILFTPQDFTDSLDLQFIKRQADNYELKGQKQYYYSYYYQWKLNSAIKVKIITPDNVLINNEQYPEYIDFIDITREGDMKNVPPK